MWRCRDCETMIDGGSRCDPCWQALDARWGPRISAVRAAYPTLPPAAMRALAASMLPIDALPRATDGDLLGVWGIGLARLERIRAVLPAPHSADGWCCWVGEGVG